MTLKKTIMFLAIAGFLTAGLSAQSTISPMRHFIYLVTIDSMQLRFQEVSGLDSQAQPAEYKRGNSPAFSVIKMPGLKKISSATMQKGLAPNTKTVSDYLDPVKNKNKIKKSDVTIELMDEDNQVEMTFILKNAFPTKIVQDPTKGSDTEIAIESMEFAHEGVTIKQ